MRNIRYLLIFPVVFMALTGFAHDGPKAEHGGNDKAGEIASDKKVPGMDAAGAGGEQAAKHTKKEPKKPKPKK